MPRRALKTTAVFMAAVLVGCAGGTVDPEPRRNPRNNRGTDEMGSIFGQEGLALSLFGAPERGEGQAGGGIGVNSYLWRASLDTVSFMPISEADPFGGVILTDWHNPAQTPGERFKLQVYILDRQLRADGLRVAVFRQVRNGESGEWEDAPVAEGTGSALEDTILTRARQLRIDSTT
jgi:hypothetical protein